MIFGSKLVVFAFEGGNEDGFENVTCAGAVLVLFVPTTASRREG